MKRILKIRHDLQNEIDKVITNLLNDCSVKFDIEGIIGYVADIRRGCAKFDGRFTVPLWAYDRRYKGKSYRGEEGYFTYYVAHELAHELKYKKYGKHSGHDFEFYEIFMTICPKKLQHFELHYKKTSSKYGISQN